MDSFAERRSALIKKYLGSRQNANDMIQALGLKNANAKGSTPRFDNDDALALWKRTRIEIDEWTQAFKLEDLKIYALREEFRDDVLEEMVKIYGPKLWGRENRSHLLTPDPESPYKKDLFYDDAEDRKLIKLYILVWMLGRCFRKSQDTASKGKGKEAKNNAQGHRDPREVVLSPMPSTSDDDDDDESLPELVLTSFGRGTSNANGPLNQAIETPRRPAPISSATAPAISRMYPPNELPAQPATARTFAKRTSRPQNEAPIPLRLTANTTASTGPATTDVTDTQQYLFGIDNDRESDATYVDSSEESGNRKGSKSNKKRKNGGRFEDPPSVKKKTTKSFEQGAEKSTPRSTMAAFLDSFKSKKHDKQDTRARKDVGSPTLTPPARSPSVHSEESEGLYDPPTQEERWTDSVFQPSALDANSVPPAADGDFDLDYDPFNRMSPRADDFPGLQLRREASRGVSSRQAEVRSESEELARMHDGIPSNITNPPTTTPTARSRPVVSNPSAGPSIPNQNPTSRLFLLLYMRLHNKPQILDQAFDITADNELTTLLDQFYETKKETIRLESGVEEFARLERTYTVFKEMRRQMQEIYKTSTFDDAIRWNKGEWEGYWREQGMSDEWAYWRAMKMNMEFWAENMESRGLWIEAERFDEDLVGLFERLLRRMGEREGRDIREGFGKGEYVRGLLEWFSVG